MADYWPQVEADFQQHYGIQDPLGLGWRRLRTLMNGLPPESRVVRLLADETLTWKDRYDLARGKRRRRTGNVRDLAHHPHVGYVRRG